MSNVFSDLFKRGTENVASETKKQVVAVSDELQKQVVGTTLINIGENKPSNPSEIKKQQQMFVGGKDAYKSDQEMKKMFDEDAIKRSQLWKKLSVEAQQLGIRLNEQQPAEKVPEIPQKREIPELVPFGSKIKQRSNMKSRMIRRSQTKAESKNSGRE